MASQVIEARWNAKSRTWSVRVPSGSWTRLRGVWGPDESEASLLVGVRRVYGTQPTRGMRVEKVNTR